MICAIDTETQGLNATRQAFIIGSITYKQNDKQQMKTYNKPQELWNKILELGEQEAKTKRNLYVYAHNMEYDFYTTVDWNDQEVKIIATKPLIIKRKNIQFIDSMNTLKLSLRKIAQITNQEKGWLNEKLKTNDNTILTKKEMEELIKYNQLDTIILYNAIKQVKETLKEDGINIRKILTSGNLAMNAYIQFLKKKPYAKELMSNKIKGKFRKINYKEEERNAYRGGRIQAIELGTFENCTQADLNSAYAESATKIQYPNLSTQKFIKNPLQSMTEKEILNTPNTIGITKCLIKTTNDKYGYMPIRYKNQEEFVQDEKWLIGSWTNYELNEMIKNKKGKIIAIEHTIQYDTLEENPLKEFMEKLFELKQKDELRKVIYKGMITHLIGKFGQKNEKQESIMGEINQEEEMKKQGYKISDWYIGKEQTKALYTKDNGISYGNYFNPIISAYITAYTRNKIWNTLQELKRPLYISTDGITFQGETNEIKNQGNKLGQWKIEKTQATTTITGQHGQQIDNEIKLAGIPKIYVTPENYKSGKIMYKRMIKLKTAKNLEEIGQFKEFQTNLKENTIEHIQKQREFRTEQGVIDEREWNTSYFKIQEELADKRKN